MAAVDTLMTAMTDAEIACRAEIDALIVDMDAAQAGSDVDAARVGTNHEDAVKTVLHALDTLQQVCTKLGAVPTP